MLYEYKSSGHFIWDAGQPWWALLKVDQGIVDLYAYFLKKYGIEVEKGSKFGPHISVVKGEEPKNKELCGNNREFEFSYSNKISYTNGRHAWLDVHSPELAEMRMQMGLDKVPKLRYHLTIGRLKHERINKKIYDSSAF